MRSSTLTKPSVVVASEPERRRISRIGTSQMSVRTVREKQAKQKAIRLLLVRRYHRWLQCSRPYRQTTGFDKR
ncbi:hypothetical protein RB2379 [Rhodopirellula baltica SH 1]|uniref:Uncharacterized protein n=1 Tax=Rhodopirellula baltica (strain DSM 10527 / NCIMB 13988 / SH1) TaxID=243090 RepID=Q7UVX5_RHOBA|nr:hypothetical protein RB2379 [Rhodopirellula baltica SH 1]